MPSEFRGRARLARAAQVSAEIGDRGLCCGDPRRWHAKPEAAKVADCILCPVRLLCLDLGKLEAGSWGTNGFPGGEVWGGVPARLLAHKIYEVPDDDELNSTEVVRVVSEPRRLHPDILPEGKRAA